MRGPITVTLQTVAVTDDGLGNTTETTTSTVYTGVRFAPRSSQERSDNRSPVVITAGSLYRRGEFPATSTSRIIITNQHPLIDGTWQVEGTPGYWGVGVEVAIKRAS